MRRALAALALLLVAAAAPGSVVETQPGGVVIDWSEGTLAAPGVAAADLHAPNTDMARVGAERIASERARAVLGKAARALLGTKLDAAASARLDAALAQARPLDVSYASDGGARVLLALPLEAVRTAAAPPEPPVDDPAAPSAVVVDAQKLGLHPVLGLRVGAGAASYALPTVWYSTPEAAAADARAGGRRAAALAASYEHGVLGLQLDAKQLESAARAGALIMVVVSEGAKR